MPYCLKRHVPKKAEKAPEPVAKVDPRTAVKRPDMDADIIKGLPSKEIERKYGVSSGAVSQRKHKLRKSMVAA